jgi:GNAT superfamily N-acetyltransferase
MSIAIIRPARLDDAKSLHHHCYPKASFEEVSSYLAWCLRQAEKGWIARIVAEIGGSAVGGVQLTEWRTAGEIGSLVVGQRYRRLGVGRQLLAAAIAEAKRRNLTVVELWAQVDQPGVQALYQAFGFRPVGETKKRLSRPPSAEPLVLLRMVG